MKYGMMTGALLAALVIAGGAAAGQEPATAEGGTVAVASPAAVAAPAAPSGLASAAAASAPAARSRSSDRWHAYVHDILGPGAWVGVGAGSALEQAETSPTQWGTGASGFGKRVASTYGDLFVQESVRHGLAAALDRSTNYHRCGCRGVGAKVGNAFVETFTDRDAEGRRQFSEPRVAGAIAGGFAPMLWWPGETVAGAATATGTSLLFTWAGNIITELVH